MKLNPVVTQANGVISISLQALFVGDATDASDKAKIAALGDPQVSLVGTGTFTDPGDTAFTFTFPTTEYYVGVTTQMSGSQIRFMTALPSGADAHWTGGSNPNQLAPTQGPLDCITTDPSRATTLWYTAMGNAVSAAMTALRQQALVPTLTPRTI